MMNLVLHTADIRVQCIDDSSKAAEIIPVVLDSYYFKKFVVTLGCCCYFYCVIMGLATTNGVTRTYPLHVPSLRVVWPNVLPLYRSHDAQTWTCQRRGNQIGQLEASPRQQDAIHESRGLTDRKR